VKVELLKAGVVSQTISASTPNDGYITGWTIPATLATGTDYRIRITSTTNAAITDTSNNYFAITSGTSAPSEIFGAEPNPTGNPIGGGAGYTRIISEKDPRVKYVVSTRDQLFSALKNAKAGDVVFVKGDANIDLTGTYRTVIPGGVTLASDRGLNGSPGGRIFRYRTDPPELENGIPQISTMLVGGDNVRITGLRFEGNDTIQDELFDSVGLDVKTGIKAFERKGLEVDNCEFWGWSHAGVSMENSKNWSTANAYIHHNYFHHCQARGWGYGVVLQGGHAVIEANIFDYTRHAIAAAGYAGEGYEARYNIHLGHGTAIGGHHFDVHPFYNPVTGQTIAGNDYKIHHNTFEPTDLYSVGIRAVPEKGVWIDHNIFKSSITPVFQRGDYMSGGVYSGRIYMTKNLIGPNQIFSATGPIKLK
jgi:hypothetical protein